MDNSDSESHTEEIEVPARGRPVGKTDQKPRYRRTAAEISADKIQIAQMRLDALKVNEEQKLAVKAATLAKRGRRPIASQIIEEKPVPPARKERPAKIETTKKVTIREDTDDSEESPQRPRKSGREALYDSWFPSSPRTNHSVRGFPF